MPDLLKKYAYTFISLFTGAGGSDLGFTQKGFYSLWANDLFKAAVATYRKNIGDHIVEENIRKVQAKHIPEADVLIGGFPCPGFSHLGRREIFASVNFLFLEVLRIIGELRPKIVVLENVLGLLTMADGKFFLLIKTMLEEMGYRVDHAVLNAKHFGTPQNRRRVFIMANRLGIPNVFPLGNGRPAPSRRDVMQLVGGADVIEKDYLTSERIKRILKRLNSRKGHTPVTKERWLAKVKLDMRKPFSVITASCGSFGAENAFLIEGDGRARRITPTEAKIAMGFPMDYELAGSRSDQYRQCGNAICPPVAAAIARCVKKMLLSADRHE